MEPKTAPDKPKRIPNAFIFHIVFCFRFWTILDPVLGPKWYPFRPQDRSEFELLFLKGSLDHSYRCTPSCPESPELARFRSIGSLLLMLPNACRRSVWPNGHTSGYGGRPQIADRAHKEPIGPRARPIGRDWTRLRAHWDREQGPGPIQKYI